MSGDSVYTEPCFVLITHNNCQLCRPQARPSITHGLFLFCSILPSLLPSSFPIVFERTVELYFRSCCDLEDEIGSVRGLGAHVLKWTGGQVSPFSPDPTTSLQRQPEERGDCGSKPLISELEELFSLKHLAPILLSI